MVERVEGSEELGETSAPRLIVAPDPLAVVGELLATSLLAVFEKRPTARLAIPGGSALEAVPPARRSLGADWRRVSLTWVDERCVAFEDVESNRGAAARLGLFEATAESTSRAGPKCLLPLFEDGETPERAARRAARGFCDLFLNAIDVALLGMGADGHIASLFPPLPPPDDRMVVHVLDSPKPPSDRITLTRRALETAGVVVLIATGESKRDALTRLANGDPTLPAHGLPGLIVVTDLELDQRARKAIARRKLA